MDAPEATASPTLASAPAPLPPPIAPRSVLVTVVLGWVLPGLGHVYNGRALKGLLMLATVGGLFYAGLALTGYTCVDPAAYELEFIAHALIGGPTAAAYWFTSDVVLQAPLPYFEVGRLYAAVAGLLNLVAICDAAGTCLDHNEGARARLRERAVLRAAAEEAVL